MDRVVSRTTLSGETVKYTYEGSVLHTITDEQDRVYTLTFNDRYDLELLRFPNGLFRRWNTTAGAGLYRRWMSKAMPPGTPMTGRTI